MRMARRGRPASAKAALELKILAVAAAVIGETPDVDDAPVIRIRHGLDAGIHALVHGDDGLPDLRRQIDRVRFRHIDGAFQSEGVAELRPALRAAWLFRQRKSGRWRRAGRQGSGPAQLRPKNMRDNPRMAVLTNPPETANFSTPPQKRPFLKETFRMPHQPVNVLLTKLTWLHFPLKRKVKGELTRRAWQRFRYG